MTDYRAYIVGKDGRFRRVEVLRSETDEEAIEKARRFVGRHAVELWHSSRRISGFVPRTKLNRSTAG